MKKTIVLVLALLSLAWTVFLTASVAFNSTSVASRVAGGQLHSFSGALRFTYAVQALVVLFQMVFLVQLFKRSGAWSSSSYLLARIFLILSALSAIVNLTSRSNLERWNAIPAFTIAYAYILLGSLKFRPARS